MPNLSSKLSSWRCFVDDSICFVKKDSIKFVLDTLANFHKKIKFTSEEKINGKFPFLNTLLVRNNHYIDTTVYRTKTNTHIYLNWNSFGPNSWKWGYTQNNCHERIWDMFNWYVSRRRNRIYQGSILSPKQLPSLVNW